MELESHETDCSVKEPMNQVPFSVDAMLLENFKGVVWCVRQSLWASRSTAVLFIPQLLKERYARSLSEYPSLRGIDGH